MLNSIALLILFTILFKVGRRYLQPRQILNPVPAPVINNVIQCRRDFRNAANNGPPSGNRVRLRYQIKVNQVWNVVQEAALADEEDSDPANVEEEEEGAKAKEV